ncbi:pyrimidine 5-prime-nucleotidase [Blumeria hordei DH14]|uniref:Pyrimidine 5-prime-nucleotidase n=1 Tax=Blumeria graminis f. sp. hordei (strain DH14) TaxID=546991 RepID=N1J8T0_BLUG1|nr:pyrimidine 5-prime-nucleotidase [Blumeria hordei DH14]
MADERPIFFFDIDNCLYPKSKRVYNYMTELIDQYFVKHLELTKEDAYKLNQEYYKNYGLAVEGLARHHKIDPMEYNRQVDDALPLESILSPDPELQKLLEGIDKSKVKLWLFTNAYITHGQRVVRLLGVDHLFEGITYCDYSEKKLICKPHLEMYEKAMREAAVKDARKCYFVDDSELNCSKADEIGWTAVHLSEDEGLPPPPKPCKYQIRHLNELRCLFPQFFQN